MITKAIVEEIISPYEVRVRIPLLDRQKNTTLSTKTEDLNIATICTLPNCYCNPQVGDIVFVGFEDNTYYRVVILGYLCKEAMTPTYSDITFNSLQVKSSASLPEETTIGNVTSSELAKLEGVRESIQKQLDNLKEQQTRLLDAVFPKEPSEEN